MRSVLLPLFALGACGQPQSPVPGKRGSDTGAPLASTGDTGPAPEEPCGPSAVRGLEVGQCAPDFTLPDRYGQPFTLSSQRGKVALVDISAVW